MKWTKMHSSLLLLVFVAHCSAAEAKDICSSLCACSPNEILDEITDVDCTNRAILQVPPVTSWPPKTASLDLGSNSITAVEFEMTFTSLRTLKLNNNKIQVVNSSAFGGLNNLKVLDLKRNLLTEIEENMFHGLGKLKILDISSNKIKVVPPMVFYNLFELEELSLARNPIVHVESTLFTRMLNLRRLDISDTKAYSLPNNLFHALMHFEYLDLSSNEFLQVPTDALRSAQSLKTLRLNDNPIEQLDKTSFRRLTNLVILEINGMDYLESIGPETFSDLMNLRVLEANYNPKLSYVDKNAFSGLYINNSKKTQSLQEVNFEMARLSTLHEKTFNCDTMQKLNLQRNPWHCDCRIKWMKTCPVSRVYTADLRCDSPPALRNELIFDLDDEKFSCDQMMGPSADDIHHDRVIRLMSLALGCAVLVTLAVGIIIVLKWKNIKTWWRVKRRGPGPVYYVRTKTYPTET